MKKITLMAVLIINSIVYSQDSKKEIINEIETYKKGKLLNTTSVSYTHLRAHETN
jgi:hypothetical protein